MVSVNGVSIGSGTVKETERWPFGQLTLQNYFQVDNLKLHTAVRTAATRAKKKYGRNFSVRKVTVEGRKVIRVYRVKARATT